MAPQEILSSLSTSAMSDEANRERGWDYGENYNGGYGGGGGEDFTEIGVRVWFSPLVIAL